MNFLCVYDGFLVIFLAGLLIRFLVGFHLGLLVWRMVGLSGWRSCSVFCGISYWFADWFLVRSLVGLLEGFWFMAEFKK